MRGLLLAMTALSLSLSGCSGSKDAAEATAKAPAGPRLLLAPVDTVNWQDVSAEVATVDQAQVMARMPGILSSLAVRAGDNVRRGQALGRVTDSGVGGSGAQAASAAAQSTLANAELNRIRFLYKNGVYAKARLEQAEAGARIASVQASAAHAQEAVIAPASGRVLRADIPAGSTVMPGMVIAVIASGPVVLRLELPESLARRVHVGSRVMASGIGDGTGSATGAVTKLYPAVQAGQISADVAVPGLDPTFIGSRVAAKVETGQRKAVIVPRAFVATRYGIDAVTVLAKDGSATQVPVQTAASSEPGKVEILSGVSAGDTLIGADAGASRP